MSETASQTSKKSALYYTYDMVLDKCETTWLFIRVHSKTAKCFVESGRHGFCGFILRYPTTIASVSGLICLVMTAVAFALHPPNLKTNTDEAFQTWGTHISGALNTWKSLTNQLTQDLPEHDGIPQNQRFSNSDSGECSSLVTVVFQASSMDDLSEGKAMTELCEAHRILKNLMNQTVPSCGGELVQPISYFSATKCQQSLATPCQDILSANENIMPPMLGGIMDMNCMGNIENTLKKIFGPKATINSALLSRGATTGNGRDTPIYTAVHVPTSNVSQLSELAYHKLKREKRFRHLSFQGIFVDDRTRTKLLEEIIKKDLISLVPICGAAILLLMWFYSGSFIYTFAALETLLFAFGVSYFVYYFIYCMKPFWFTNYLSAVILLGIGADDCFVLFHSLKGEHRTTKNMRHAASEQDMTVPAFAQASLAMFVTSLTTAIAFLTNMMTDVIAIKAFGIFAATLVMINYLLVVSFLPACLMFNDHHWEPLVQKNISKWNMESVRSFFQRISDKAFNEVLPLIIDKTKGFLVLLMLVASISSAVVTFHNPKLPLAHNSSQLFHKDHPIQWFLDNFVDKFDITQPPVAETIHSIWGMRPVDTSSRYHRDWPSEIEMDRWFKLTHSFLDRQRLLCEILQKNGFEADCFARKFELYQTSTCPTGRSQQVLESCIKRYLVSLNGNASTMVSDGMRNGPLFHRETHEVRGYVQNFVANFPAVSSDCRYVEQTRHQVNTTFTNAAGLLNGTNLAKGWIVPNSNMAARILYKCDLKTVLQGSTLASVAAALSIALAVVICVTRNVKLGVASIFVILTVILCTTAALVLLKWELNIVESIIITLGVGLSFDFTLHYAVAYRAHGSQCSSSKAKIAAMLDEAGVPVFLSALSTLTAGFVFGFAEAYPFYQVGVFMVLITVSSWIGSTFMFTAFIAFIDVCIEACSKENLEVNFGQGKEKELSCSGGDPLDAAQLQGLLQ